MVPKQCLLFFSIVEKSIFQNISYLVCILIFIFINLKSSSKGPPKGASPRPRTSTSPLPYPCTLQLPGMLICLLYWHKLKTLNYITKLIMFSHNCVVTRNYIAAINNFMLMGSERFFKF